MAFPPEARTRLLAVKGVGPTVVDRLERIGFDSLDALADADVDLVLRHIAAMLGATCWRNSPQARAAITGAIDAARTASFENASGGERSA